MVPSPRLKVAHFYQESGIRFSTPHAAQLHIYHTMQGLQRAGHEMMLLLTLHAAVHPWTLIGVGSPGDTMAPQPDAILTCTLLCSSRFQFPGPVGLALALRHNVDADRQRGCR